VNLGLDGKVAWVLGGSSGLGLASAKVLAQEGASVAISARGENRLATATAELNQLGAGKFIGVPLDVSDGAALNQSAAEIESALGGFDILVANAGGPPPGTFDDFDDDALYDAFTLTTASAWRATKAVLPSMRSRGGGAIVYITSITTKEVVDRLLLSNMMRAAVVGMAKTLARELAGDGIRVVCVAPGHHDTPRVQQLDEARAKAESKPVEEIQARTAASIPAGRLGDPMEFGAAVAFLASEAASFISGVSLTVDGGQLRSMST
jgi:3-oxoacyl-[acyl-carrier protein] reductase